MLNVENVTKIYNNRSILKNVTFEFKSNTFYAITGESGAGKTTLLSLLAGIEQPSSGLISYLEKDISKMAIASYLRNNSIIFQQFNLINYLTARENVSVALDIWNNKSEQKKYISEVLTKVGITEELQNIVCARMSGGQQQRVAIARALAQNGNIIFADEPTGNLDFQTSKSIISLLKGLTFIENKCVICVTHSPEVVAEADVVLHLEEGKLSHANKR